MRTPEDGRAFSRIPDAAPHQNAGEEVTVREHLFHTKANLVRGCDGLHRMQEWRTNGRSAGELNV
jgi:hypothetical protein